MSAQRESGSANAVAGVASLYLVHLLPDNADPACFRAAVRRVDCDAGETFSDAAALVDYFARELATAACRLPR